MKIYINISTILIFLIVFQSCKIIRDVTEEPPVKEGIEVTDNDRRESTALLINASKEEMIGNYINAVALYSQALKKDPYNSAAAYKLAKLHAIEQLYRDAIRYAEIAAYLEPKNQYYLMLLADVYAYSGNFSKAIDTYEKIAEIFPNDISVQIDLLSNYLMLNKYEEAIKVFEHIETIAGFSEHLSIKKVQLLIENEIYDKAIEETKKLIDAFPDEPLYRELLAEIYIEKDLTEEAKEVYKEILEIDPEYAIARLHLADYYRQQGETEKFFNEVKKAFRSPQLAKENKGRIMFVYYMLSEEDEKYLKQALELMDILISIYPEEAEMFAMYGDFLFMNEQYEKARDMFLKTTKLDPDRYLAWEQMIYLSIDIEDYDFIVEHAEKALDYFFEKPEIYFYIAIAYMQKEMYKEATEVLEEGVILIVDNKPFKSHFYTLMGDSYHKLEKHEKSDNSYKKALEIDPKNKYALNNYSYYLSLREKNLEEALEMSEKANKLEEDNPAFQDTFGWINYKMGEYKTAKKWIKKAISNSEEKNATILEHYGDVLYKLGDKEKAIKYWKKAGELDNESEFLEKKIKNGTLYE